MVTRAMRALAWTLVAAVAVLALSGCNNATVKMRLANDGILSVTELLVYPSPAEGEAPGSEAQINRMPKDASGSTIALLPNDAVLLDSKFRNLQYDVSLTFYDSKNQVFRKAVVASPLDLTAVKRGSLVILTAAIDKNNAITATYEIVEEDAGIAVLPSWLGGGFIAAAAVALLPLLLWWLCPSGC